MVLALIIALSASACAKQIRRAPGDPVVKVEFHLVLDSPRANGVALEDPDSHTTLILDPRVLISNTDIKSVAVDRRGTFYDVMLYFSPEGAARMEATTSAHVGGRIAIVLDGHLASAPRISSAISDAAAISHAFTEAEALALARGLAP